MSENCKIVKGFTDKFKAGKDRADSLSIAFIELQRKMKRTRTAQLLPTAIEQHPVKNEPQDEFPSDSQGDVSNHWRAPTTRRSSRLQKSKSATAIPRGNSDASVKLETDNFMLDLKVEPENCMIPDPVDIKFDNTDKSSALTTSSQNSQGPSSLKNSCTLDTDVNRTIVLPSAERSRRKRVTNNSVASNLSLTKTIAIRPKHVPETGQGLTSVNQPMGIPISIAQNPVQVQMPSNQFVPNNSTNTMFIRIPSNQFVHNNSQNSACIQMPPNQVVQTNFQNPICIQLPQNQFPKTNSQNPVCIQVPQNHFVQTNSQNPVQIQIPGNQFLKTNPQNPVSIQIPSNQFSQASSQNPITIQIPHNQFIQSNPQTPVTIHIPPNQVSQTNPSNLITIQIPPNHFCQDNLQNPVTIQIPAGLLTQNNPQNNFTIQIPPNPIQIPSEIQIPSNRFVQPNALNPAVKIQIPRKQFVQTNTKNPVKMQIPSNRFVQTIAHNPIKIKIPSNQSVQTNVQNPVKFQISSNQLNHTSPSSPVPTEMLSQTLAPNHLHNLVHSNISSNNPNEMNCIRTRMPSKTPDEADLLTSGVPLILPKKVALIAPKISSSNPNNIEPGRAILGFNNNQKHCRIKSLGGRLENHTSAPDTILDNLLHTSASEGASKTAVCRSVPAATSSRKLVGTSRATKNPVLHTSALVSRKLQQNSLSKSAKNKTTIQTQPSTSTGSVQGTVQGGVAGSIGNSILQPSNSSASVVAVQLPACSTVAQCTTVSSNRTILPHVVYGSREAVGALPQPYEKLEKGSKTKERVALGRSLPILPKLVPSTPILDIRPMPTPALSKGRNLPVSQQLRNLRNSKRQLRLAAIKSPPQQPVPGSNDSATNALSLRPVQPVHSLPSANFVTCYPVFAPTSQGMQSTHQAGGSLHSNAVIIFKDGSQKNLTDETFTMSNNTQDINATAKLHLSDPRSITPMQFKKLRLDIQHTKRVSKGVASRGNSLLILPKYATSTAIPNIRPATASTPSKSRTLPVCQRLRNLRNSKRLLRLTAAKSLPQPMPGNVSTTDLRPCGVQLEPSLMSKEFVSCYSVLSSKASATCQSSSGILQSNAVLILKDESEKNSKNEAATPLGMTVAINAVSKLDLSDLSSKKPMQFSPGSGLQDPIQKRSSLFSGPSQRPRFIPILPHPSNQRSSIFSQIATDHHFWSERTIKRRHRTKKLLKPEPLLKAQDSLSRKRLIMKMQSCFVLLKKLNIKPNRVYSAANFQL